MRCAVVGCGLAGLATAYELIHRGANVTLYDLKSPEEIGGSLPSALLHPYPGKRGVRSKRATEGLKKAMTLINEAERVLGEPVALRNGILRKNWKAEEWYDDLQEVNEGIVITSGWTVFLERYLRGLFQLLAPTCSFVQGEFQEEEKYDRVVYAIGPGFRSWDLPEVQFVKGQVLLCRERHYLGRSIIGGGHISPTPQKGIVQIGATYEHHSANDGPDLQAAKRFLTPRIRAFLDPMEFWDVIECRSCVRVCGKGSYLPLIKWINQKSLIFTGLGSRGLLYHALYAQYVGEMITSN